MAPGAEDGTRCGAGQQTARQRALFTRCRSTWRRATRRSRSADGVDDPGLRSGVGAVTAPGCHLGGIGSTADRIVGVGSPARLPWAGCPPLRSGSTSTCRSARRGAATATSTPTRRPSWPGPARRRTGGWTRCAASWRWPRSVVGPRPVDTVFVGGGTPSLLGARAARRGARRRPVDVRAGPGRRGDDGEQPGVDVAGVLRRAGRGRVHAGVAGDAVGGAARAAGAGAPAHAGAARSRRRGRRARRGSRTSTWT